MTVVERMAAALESAEEFLKIVAVYHRDGVLLESAPDYLTSEFTDALALAGGKCSEALEHYRISQN